MTNEVRYLIWVSILVLYFGGLLGVTAFAWFRGRHAERYGAALYFVAAIASVVAAEILSGPATAVFEVACDSVVAIGFLILAARFNSLWLGAALLIKGLQLALHATHLTDRQDLILEGVNIYALGLTLISFAILAIILGGTLASVHERRRTAAKASPGGNEGAATAATAPLGA